MRRLLTSGIFVAFCFFSLTLWAQVPQLLNHQGRLTDDAGMPITTATTLRFSLYQGGDAATPGSGTLVYQEDASVTPDSSGVFNHLVGSGTVIYGTLDSTVFQTASPVYLEITVDPAGLNETLLPRKQIVTVGYSFKSELADDADTVDGNEAADFAPVAHTHDASNIVSGKLNNARLNMGSGNGIDADKLDGKHSSSFYTKSESDSRFVNTSGDDMTGTLNINTSSSPALRGTTSQTDGRGVVGLATATSGYSFGVYGESSSTYGRGVVGLATATSGDSFGVFGESSSTIGRGVVGLATATSGDNCGVYAKSDSPDGDAVFAWNSAGGRAGFFHGQVGVLGTFVVEGYKSCVQTLDNGKKVLLYAMESPEIWFEDFGTAKLVDGRAVVHIESVFVQTANTGIGYFVFLTPNGECQGLYIARKDKDSFEVRELEGGTSSISFDYRIVAKRKGYEEVRFEEFTEPKESPAKSRLKQPQRRQP